MTDVPGIVARKAVVPEDRLAALADQPNTTVYAYTYKTPTATLPPSVQTATFQTLVMGFDTACRAFPDWSDEALRECVMERDSRVRLFQQLYPKLFAACTVRARTPVMEERLDKTRKFVAHSLLTRMDGKRSHDEQQEQALATGMRLAMRPASELDMSGATVLDDHVRSQGVEPSTVTPLDRMEFGPSSVRQ